jgi:hypothetical protein
MKEYVKSGDEEKRKVKEDSAAARFRCGLIRSGDERTSGEGDAGGRQIAHWEKNGLTEEPTY